MIIINRKHMPKIKNNFFLLENIEESFLSCSSISEKSFIVNGCSESIILKIMNERIN